MPVQHCTLHVTPALRPCSYSTACRKAEGLPPECLKESWQWKSEVLSSCTRQSVMPGITLENIKMSLVQLLLYAPNHDCRMFTCIHLAI